MERPVDLVNYTAVDREFFEPYGRRPIDEGHFVEPVQGLLPEAWRMRRSGIWMHCTPPHARLPAQGWKIHVSSVPSTAKVVLMITAAALVARGTPFKFAADERLLASLNGKRWPRGGSGKFITVYPQDADDFRRTIDDLYAILAGYVGPYVLTDRRYRDSRVLYYRYGGIDSEFQVSAGGRREWLLRGPDGTPEPDDRLPRFRLPSWARDPFPDAASPSRAPRAGLGGGRYRVIRALAFSAAGGVYLADDLDEGRRVVIKEARPCIGAHVSATDALRKEFRILRRLHATRVTPAPVAHFQEWEHAYLVEEYIEGTTLRLWLGRRYPWLRVHATRDDVRAYLKEIAAIFTVLAEALTQVHAAGVSLGDLSFHNCIVQADGRVRVIDLEAAIEHGVDATLDLRTPGFASASPDRREAKAACAEDTYAFGANLFAAVMPVNAMLPLDPSAATRFTRSVCTDLGYPMAFVDVIGALLADDPAARPSVTDAMRRLVVAIDQAAAVDLPPRIPLATQAGRVADDLFGYIGARALQARADRYVPSGPEVFESHPWGIAHGAAGVLHAFLRGGRQPPAGLCDYLLQGTKQSRERGSSLMHGDAGIAWVLFEAGMAGEAAALLRRQPLDAAVRRHAGLHDGLAGWGLARLKAWHETAEVAFLDDALHAGDALLGDGIAVGETRHWRYGGDDVPVGLGHGAAGIGLFLLHLFEATGESRFERAARHALAHDLGQRMTSADGIATWPKEVGGVSRFPYFRHGTAGILAVVARFFACTGDTTYRDILLGAEADLMRRHAVSPGLFYGLAGVGEVLLDLAAFLPERAATYQDAARRLAGGIEPFLIRRAEGLAVPGAELLRLSCDLATGNAGVGAFLDRLQHGGPASFLLDERLPTAQTAMRTAC